MKRPSSLFVFSLCSLDGLGLVPGHLRRARRADHARGAAHLLLPCALGHGGLLFFAVSLAGSIGFLAFRRNRPERAYMFPTPGRWLAPRSCVVFCTVVLITGPLWGRRAWGIWWTWDARLTTTLVLWLIYVSYLLLRRFAAGPQVQTLAAVLGYLRARSTCLLSTCRTAGWLTQHPAPVFGGGPRLWHQGSADAGRLWLECAGLAGVGMVILALRYRVECFHDKIAAAEAEAALNA